MTVSEKILLSREGRVLRITLNRPDKKNALDHEMYRAMTMALRLAEKDDEVAVVMFDSAGDSFTAGNDLKAFLNAPVVNDEAPAPEFLKTIHHFPKIILAAVKGFAVGIGTTMLLHCDLIVATHDAKFQLPFINLGLVPEAASSLLLPARLGHAKAAELLLLGDAFDAHAALSMGLVNKLVDHDRLQATMDEMAARVAAKPLFALMETKRLLKHGNASVERHMDEEFKSFAACLQRDEFKAAAEKFFNKT